MTKPHIWFTYGTWYCKGFIWWGIGKSPKQAYRSFIGNKFGDKKNAKYR